MKYTNKKAGTPAIERPVPKAGRIANLKELTGDESRKFFTLIGSFTNIENPPRDDKNIPWVSGLSIHYWLLSANEEDGQSPHYQDEIYYILEGSGKILFGDDKDNLTTKPVVKGDVVYIPAYMHHHFVPTTDLKILIFFGPDFCGRHASLEDR